MVKRQHIKISPKKGFTLVEIMVTVAILSFGIVAIYQALFVSTDVYGYYTRYFSTQDWLSEQIWKMQQQLTEHDFIEVDETSGQITRDHKTFDWSIEVVPIDIEEGLYRVDVSLSWFEGSRSVSVSRTAYLMSPKLKNYEDASTV